MFAPALGVAEDPATGSAAGPLAMHLGGTAGSRSASEIEIRQGAEIHRPSLLHARRRRLGRADRAGRGRRLGRDRRARRVPDLSQMLDPETFGALASPKRLQILEWLKDPGRALSAAARRRPRQGRRLRRLHRRQARRRAADGDDAPADARARGSRHVEARWASGRSTSATRRRSPRSPDRCAPSFLSRRPRGRRHTLVTVAPPRWRHGASTSLTPSRRRLLRGRAAARARARARAAAPARRCAARVAIPPLRTAAPAPCRGRSCSSSTSRARCGGRGSTGSRPGTRIADAVAAAGGATAKARRRRSSTSRRRSPTASRSSCRRRGRRGGARGRRLLAGARRST